MPRFTTFATAMALVVVTAQSAGAQTPGAAEQTAAMAARSDGQPTAPPAPAAPRLQVTAGTEFMATSAYVWRGFVPNASFSVQPNTWVKVGDITVSSWMNVAREHAHNRPVTEHDLTVDYSKTRGNVTWSAGWINYVFPELTVGRHSNEVYVGVAHVSYLNPSVKVYQDVHEGSGTYVSAAVNHAYEVGRFTLTPNAALGYNHHQWIDVSTFSDLNVGLKLTVPTPIKRLTLAPFVNHSRSLDTSVIPNRTFGGLAFAVR
jgi:hypothetical protein